MSAALTAGNDDSDYASNYVKLQGGELPIRWCAIEVLVEGKYSKASDVWAFGILTFEVLTRGNQPYSEFSSMSEVAERIKEGYTMPCPASCPREVHSEIMQPCWKPNPRERPGFGQLASELLKLGAVATHDSQSGAAEFKPAPSRSSPSRSSSVLSWSKDSIKPRTSSTSRDGYAEWQAELADRTLLGPSVHHVNNVLVPKVLAAVKPPWTDHSGRSLQDPAEATVGHAVQAVAKPCGAQQKCPRDGKMGCAYVDTLQDRDDVGRADALLSYTWQYKVKSVGAALTRWAETAQREEKRTYIWICSLCLNQHRMATAQTPEALANEFGPRVLAIGRVLPMLEPWRKPGPFRCSALLLRA